MQKLVIVTAPSGAGKTTIVHHLLNRFPSLAFSISATTRPKRAYETDGKDYYFVSEQYFRELIGQNAFIEWQEVYECRFYGTLRREIERLWQENRDIIFDIDVKGALLLKHAFPQNSLSIFIKPPSTAVLMERLKNRKTESAEDLQKRMARALEELSYEDKFDCVLVNDILDKALEEAETFVRDFLGASSSSAMRS